MAGVLVAGGESFGLQYLTGKLATQGLTLKLFKNNHTPTEADTISDYTEANFTGYAGKALTAATWSVSGSNPTQIQYPQQTFTSSADQTPQSVFGYYLVRTTGGELVAAEAFASAVSVQNNGDEIKVTPTLTLGNA